MPQIKHDFSAGKMNKDLDERIVPNGQYRDAMNVQVRTTSSDGGIGNAGALQNLQGNKAIIESIHYERHWEYKYPQKLETTFVGSVANEKNNKAYFFISSPDYNEYLNYAKENTGALFEKKFIDYIVEVNLSTSEPTCVSVVTDYYGIIDHRNQVIDTSQQIQYEDDNWLQLTVQNTQDLRVGMIMQAYDSNGNPLIYSDWTNPSMSTNLSDTTIVTNYGAEIQKIIGNDIFVYTPQNTVNWFDTRFFTFTIKPEDRVLNFHPDRYINGINIIDNLLFWTDNNDEPKKVNIDRCKQGTTGFKSHTQLKLKDPNDDDILLDYVGDGQIEQSLSPMINNDLKKDQVTLIRKAPRIAPVLEMKNSDRDGETVVGGFDYNFASVSINNVIQNVPLGWIFTVGDESDETFNEIDWKVNDILRFTEETFDVDSWLTAIVESVDWSGEGTGNGNKVITLRVVTINKTLSSDPEDAIDGSGTWTISLSEKDPMFELVFGRFSTRYKYEDGEYSSFGPWSKLAFLPGRFDFDHKKGYNLGMTNTLRKLTIKDFIPHQRDRDPDVCGVDLLYKTTNNANVYLVKSIVRGRDAEWDNFVIDDENPTLAFGEMDITTEMIRRVLPNNQQLRSWDNVPRTALAQEVAANRLILANYTQGYEVFNKPHLKQALKSYATPSPDTPQPSIKSLRDYQIGMVFGDKYGRETPIISPGYLEEKHHGRWGTVDGNIRIPKIFSGTQNTFELQQYWGEESPFEGVPDNWISYVKYFIKETSNEYYNLVMDKWYSAEDGNIWLSFASADRNKLDEDTYLILKNEHGTENPVSEKARYKVIAIESEAPDFIKQQERYMGKVTLGSFTPSTDVTEDSNWAEYMWEGTPDPLNAAPTKLISGTEIAIREDKWNDFLGGYKPQGDLQIRLMASTNSDGTGITAGGQGSEAWRLVTYYHKVELPDDEDDPDDINGSGAIRWDEAFEADGNLFNILSSEAGGTPLASITWFLEFREMVTKSQPEFEGKFFVKIERDPILMSKVLSTTASQTSYNVSETFPLAYIDNQEYNPAELFPDHVGPRRAYKWMNQPGLTLQDSGTATESLGTYGATQSFEYVDGDGNTQSTTLEVSAAAVTNEGNAGMNNVVDLNAGMNDNVPWSGEVNAPNGQIDGSQEWPGCGNSDEQGCHPYDAEFLALGCTDTEANQGTGGGGGSDGVNSMYFAGADSAENPYNRTTETAQFWSWFQEYASTENNQSDTGNHGAKLFIDGMRTRLTRFFDSSTLMDFQGTGEDHQGIYYKQTGLDPGLLDSTLTTGLEIDEFGPTGSELGRMVISCPGNAFPGDENDSGFGLYQKLTTYGTLFKFMNDPTNDGEGKTYKIITSQNTTAVDMTMRNHSQTWWDIEYGNAPDNNATGSFFAHSPYFETWQYGNPVDTPWAQGPSEAHGPMGFTNINPKHSKSGVAGFADGETTFVSVGGYIPGDAPESVPTQYTCQPCGEVDFTYGDQTSYVDGSANGGSTCERTGVRVEFRLFDRDSGMLVDSGTRGINTGEWDPRGEICHDGREAMNIGIVTQTTTGGDVYIPPSNPAIWETEPKEDVGLDIYYEATNAIPVRLTSENTTNFVPYGSKVETKNWNQNGAGYVTPNIPLGGQTISYLYDLGQEWISKGHYVSYIGYTAHHSVIGIKSTEKFYATNIYGGMFGVSTEHVMQRTGIDVGQYLVFTHPDGTKTMSRVLAFMEPVDIDGSAFSATAVEDSGSNVIGYNFNNVDYLSEQRFRETSSSTGFYKIDSDVFKFPVELNWHNCYSFGNGVESDRIRDDFNAPQIDNGVKVSASLLNYGREVLGSRLIYSGLYNATSSVNKLNEFNMAEKITKDINPSYGTIQALKTRDTDVVVLTEDKVLKVIANKDALYNADGNPQLIATDRVLGQAIPFSGDYGISNNPESLAADQFRIYFTDKQRGAVLRLSQDGLTPISEIGMRTWFRDNLRLSRTMLGSFDSVNGEYNLTLDPNGGKATTTLSFNEESKGWVSFKSFIPQTGLSIAGSYLTAVSRKLNTQTETNPRHEKGMWKHHTDILSNDPVDFGEVINRNVFYAPENLIQDGSAMQLGTINNITKGWWKPSSVTVLFNDMPEVVKNFKTLNYDGSQARVDRFTNATAWDVGGNPFSVSSNQEYNDLNTKYGWYVQSLVTDLHPFYDDDNGGLRNAYARDFKEKEGKWFSDIRGGKRSGDGDLVNPLEDKELKEFSVQGLGIMQVDPTPVEETTVEEGTIPPVEETTYVEETTQVNGTIQIVSDYIDDPDNITD